MSAWLFLALLAPFLFSISNIFDKLLMDRHLGTFNYAILSGLAFFWGLALLPFVGFPHSAAVIIAGLATGVLFFLTGFPYFHALSIEEVSRVIPLWALEAPITLLLALVFLKERLSFNDYAGFVLVVAGTFLVSVRRLSEALKPSRALLFMLLATLLTSLGIIISKWLYSQTPFWSVQALFWLGGGLTALLVLAVFSKRRKAFFEESLQLKKEVLVKFAIREIFLIAGFLVFGLAIMTGFATLSVALVQLSALYVFIIAALLSRFLPHILEEKIDKKTLLTKAVAIAMIIAGVFAINL